MYTTFLPTPPGPSRNAFYARLQQRIGCQLKISFIPASDYGTKFQTMIAGNDLPDVCNFPLPTPDQPRVMDKLFADLGPYLAGDKAMDFPYLANLPTASWKPTVANGTVYAVPQPRALSGTAMYARLDLITQVGANPQPGSYDDFLELLTAVTDAKAQRWAFGNPTNMVTHLQMMLGAPNNWSEEGGKFVSSFGDERSTEAVARTAEMVRKGLFHPDSSSLEYTRIRELFFAGRLALTSDGYAGWDLFVRELGGGPEATAKLGLVVEPKAEGGGDARHFSGTGFQGLTVIKKGLGEERTRKVLDVLNYLATPIGSREHLERKYGVKGIDYTIQDGLPTLTDRGNREFMDVQYVADSQTIIGPGVKEGVDYQYTWHQRVTKDLVPDPSIGLYSDTYSRKGAALNKMLGDARLDVIFARKPLTHLQETYAAWREKGGDAIAAEYAESKTAGR
ncbi:extracellular solute-binding protein [Microlunatus sp. Gsoil 973]|uniref:extracellular solute-binding protein n=1 Tax=Microlunatus sp. Gsoil 973 TaxID=2672569 RepID=UPI001E43C30B|nr:extracellular solute-binding protein [Microlunatus sp. Gsoil 973]